MYLEEETVASLLLNRRLDSQRVGHSQIVTNDLDAALLRKVGPGLPVILVERVLDRNNWVLLDVAQVQICKFDARNPLARIGVGVLEIEVVFAIFVELGRRDVECDLDLALVAGFLDGFLEELERFLSARNVGCETTLVTDVDGCREMR